MQITIIVDRSEDKKNIDLEEKFFFKNYSDPNDALTFIAKDLPKGPLKVEKIIGTGIDGISRELKVEFKDGRLVLVNPDNGWVITK